MSECFKVSQPTTLKGALEFLGALCHNPNDLKGVVGRALEERVRAKLKLHEAPKSVTDADESSKTIEKTFTDVLTGLEQLRREILQTDSSNLYGSYTSLHRSPHNDPSCVDTCVRYILEVLPKLYTTLDYLRFQVDSDYGDLGGGRWEEQYINGQDYVDSGHSLSKWLKSRQPDSLSASGSPSEFSPTFLPGGYGSDLKEVQGGELVSTLNDILIDSGLGEDGFLQHLFLDFGIVTKWSPCNVATCLAVLAALCKKSPTFGNRITKYEGLNRVLESLPANLELLAPDKENDT